MPIVTHALEDNGYRTGFTGKGWAPGDWRALGLRRHPNGQEFNALKHPRAVAAGLDQRDYAANFGQFLNQTDAGKPFFFWLGSTEPHRAYDQLAYQRMRRELSQIQVPQFLPDSEVCRRDLAAYYSEIEWQDQQLGRALGLLEEKQLLDNTLVIVTSDNGMPFPRAKVNLYDAGLHMPLAMAWPGRIQPGVTDAFVSHTDLPATILAAAGLPNLPGAVGHNVLRGARLRSHVLAGMERHTYCRPEGATYPMRSIRTRDYLYIRNFAPERWPTGGPDFVSSNKTYHGDIDGAPIKDELPQHPREWALAADKRPAEELYALAADPGQLQNVAQEPAHQEAKQQLKATLERELRETADPRIAGLDPWQAYPYRQTIGFGASFNTALSEAERAKARGLEQHKPE